GDVAEVDLLAVALPHQARVGDVVANPGLEGAHAGVGGLLVLGGDRGHGGDLRLAGLTLEVAQLRPVGLGVGVVVRDVGDDGQARQVGHGRAPAVRVPPA